DPPRQQRAHLSQRRVPHRLLPLDAVLGTDPAVPADIRRHRHQQGRDRGVCRRARHPVQQRVRRDECAQAACHGSEGDGRVALADLPRCLDLGEPAADFRRTAQRSFNGAGHRGGRRNVHRLGERTWTPDHRRPAGAQCEEHVRRDPGCRHSGLPPQRAVSPAREIGGSLERAMTLETVARAAGEVVARDAPFVPGPIGTHITIRSLTKYFAGTPLYENFDLNFPKAVIVSIFGPNGCGKSTLINMIAGLTPIDDGQILFDGKSLRDTKIGYVFQNYREALFPWLRTVDNIGYPLKLAGETPGEVARRVEELVASFEVKFDLRRYPYELSGGQQQTASIMRALAPRPEVLFLDEPFS